MSDPRDGDARADRSGRIDLRAWAAPPVPRDLADRVLERVADEGVHTEVGARPGPTATAAAEPALARRAWPRYLAVAAGGAAAAAAITWWLVASPRGSAPP